MRTLTALLLVACCGLAVACDGKSPSAPTLPQAAATPTLHMANPNEQNPKNPTSDPPENGCAGAGCPGQPTQQQRYDACMTEKIRAICPTGCYQVLLDAFDSECRAWVGMDPANARIPIDMKQPAPSVRPQDWACNTGSCDDYQQP